MTEQEYRKALHEIRVKAEKERVMLARKFATEHSPVKVGDWIISHRGYEYNSLPCLVYKGKTCKKDGTPRKYSKKCRIEQRNLLRLNGEPVKNHGYGE